jgi:serine/threonine-protein kinase
VKLLDFGIARATMKLRANTPIGGLIKGKLSYLSPEQVRGHQVDGRSDVFSLGVVLWECLTGVRLFYNPNDLETMRNVLHRQVPRPSEMRHGLAETLDHIVMKALERDLDKRYPDAGAMAADLEEYLREVRFSSETLVQLLEELFADEDSARELPLPGDGSSSAIEIKISTGGRPASSGDSLQPPPTSLDGSTADDAENSYATVSSIHRLSEVAARHRRRRIFQASAGGAVLLAGMLFAAVRIPGRQQPTASGPRAELTAPAAAVPAPSVVPVVPAPQPAPAAPAPAVAARTPAESPRAADADTPRTPARQAGNGAANMSVDPARGRKALARGMQALNSGEYMRAVQELENACQASPRDPEALRALAEAEFELARYGRALGHARKAAMLAPRDARFRMLVGDSLFKLRRYKEAADAFGFAAALAPGDAAIRARMQLAKEKIGSGDEARGPVGGEE